MARALRITHLLEPLLRSLVPPSRFAAYNPEHDRYDTGRPNDYCRPVSSVYAIGDLDEETTSRGPGGDGRSRSGGLGAHGNFQSDALWEGPEPHVEVRLLGGTTEAGKLIPWLSLWMRILWAAGGDDRVSDYDLSDPAENFPDLDIEDMNDVIRLPTERQAFLDNLRCRQEEIFELGADMRSFWRGYPRIRSQSIGDHRRISATNLGRMAFCAASRGHSRI